MDHISEVYPARFAKVFLSGFSAGTNITQKVILHYGKLRKNYGRQLQIQGAMCVCINYDYVASRDRLESTFIGCVYSMLMCWLVKDILHRNSHVHHELPGGRSAVSRILSRCVYLSHYDQHAALHLHGYKSEESLQHALSMFEVHNIDVPLLALQPQDDPLHLVGLSFSILSNQLF